MYTYMYIYMYVYIYIYIHMYMYVLGIRGQRLGGTTCLALPSGAVSHYIVLHQRMFVGLMRNILRKHPCGSKSLHGLTSSTWYLSNAASLVLCVLRRRTRLLLCPHVLWPRLWPVDCPRSARQCNIYFIYSYILLILVCITLFIVTYYSQLIICIYAHDYSAHMYSARISGQPHPGPVMM